MASANNPSNLSTSNYESRLQPVASSLISLLAPTTTPLHALDNQFLSQNVEHHQQSLFGILNEALDLIDDSFECNTSDTSDSPVFPPSSVRQ